MKLSTKVNLIIVITITIITVLIFIILAHRYEMLIRDNLLQTARSFYKNIIITREWIAQHNGVFVEKTEEIQTNPYLRDADIKTVDNRVFTLKNPALITRELSELSESMGGRFKFHITSLEPINPSNAPNEFEKRALESFRMENFKEPYLEYSRIEKIDDNRYFRYFGPLYTETSCISCHRAQGYKVGDVRGGISVILPMDSIERAKHTNYVFMIHSGVFTILVLSLTLNLIIRRVVIKPLQKIEQAAKALEQGDYVPLNMDENDEIGDLAQAFQSMQEKIQLSTKELQQSEKKYRTLINCSAEAVLILNEHGKIIESNDSITRLSQYLPGEIIEKPVDVLFESTAKNSFKGQSLKTDRFEATIEQKDGSLKPVEIYISPTYYETEQEAKLRLFYLHDLTERKRIEKIMVETEKMFALHQLSSGIAHEIRNPLFSVRNNLNYLKEKNENSVEQKHIYAEINTGLQRINLLVNSILDFARPHQPEFKLCDIRTVVQRALNLIRKQFEDANHALDVHFDDDLPEVELDTHKIEQVFINLSTNSLQAMKENGVFSISVQAMKRKLKILVRDNGPGISEDDVTRIFDPFFTRSTNGTGLGLSIVKSIIQQHNGEISVKSEPGRGATFKIILPLKQK